MVAQIDLDIINLKANIDWENQTCDDIDQQFRAISEVVSMVAQIDLDIITFNVNIAGVSLTFLASGYQGKVSG